jgi:hypothetical protein
MKTLLIRWYRSLSKVLVGILRQPRPDRVSFFVIPPDFDPNRAEAFSERVRSALNEAAVVLMISLGQRTGLFRAMAEHGPGTPNQIAIRAGLHERYVREWLAAMVTGGVVEFDVSLQSYRLPAEHARSLSRAALPLGLGWLARLIPILGANEGRIVECFRTGGGVAESEYPDFAAFHEDLQAQLSATIPRTVLPLVPGLDARLRAGIDVLEVGCGGGRVLESLAERYPASRFTTWAAINLGTNGSYYDVGSCGSGVYVVGRTTQGSPVEYFTLHNGGTGWTQLPDAPPRLQEVTCLASGDLYFLGSGLLYRLTGPSFEDVEIGSFLHGLWGAGARDLRRGLEEQLPALRRSELETAQPPFDRSDPRRLG